MLEILNQYKDFNCMLRHKDVNSALSRAKTQECKKIIRKTGCLLQTNKLYISNIDRTCTMPKHSSDYPRGITDAVATGPPVRVVFLLSVHGRAFRQVKRLLKSIYSSNHYYYFHVDQVSRSNLSNSLSNLIILNALTF